MKTTLSFQVEWDREKESLTQLRVKYNNFKEHVARLQLNGTLPRGPVQWKLTTVKQPKALPPAVAVEDVVGGQIYVDNGGGRLLRMPLSRLPSTVQRHAVERVTPLEMFPCERVHKWPDMVHRGGEPLL